MPRLHPPSASDETVSATLARTWSDRVFSRSTTATARVTEPIPHGDLGTPSSPSTARIVTISLPTTRPSCTDDKSDSAETRASAAVGTVQSSAVSISLRWHQELLSRTAVQEYSKRFLMCTLVFTGALSQGRAVLACITDALCQPISSSRVFAMNRFLDIQQMMKILYLCEARTSVRTKLFDTGN